MKRMKERRLPAPISMHFRRLMLAVALSLFLPWFIGAGVKAYNGYAQSVKLSLNLKEVTIGEVIEQIEKNTEFIFVFYDDVIDINRKVSVNVTDVPVEAILDLVFASTGNTYVLFDRQIVIAPPKKEIVSPVENVTVAVPTVPQPQRREISGIVTDPDNMPVLGVTVVVKGTTIGTITDAAGNYTLQVPLDAQSLVFSYIGLKPQEIVIGNLTTINVIMQEEAIGLEEVVAIGYGIQKKASVVGAIVQVTSDKLEQAGGVANLAQALSGQLPGVAIVQETGEPGADDPRILIRGQGTWNNSEPLILVDGIERRMNDLDVSEVQSISVLKDASATAVFGVKGAEGVILITTKRGSVGKPVFTVDANVSTKLLSRIPEKLNSYDQFAFRNQIIEYELNHGLNNDWAEYMPTEVLNYYKQPQEPGMEYIFPDVDWVKEMTKPFPVSRRANLSVSGGTLFAKYFASLTYNYDDDIVKTGVDPMNAGYKSKLGYERINYRTNLDLNLTRSTVFSTNIAGWIGNKYSGFGDDKAIENIFMAYAQASPDMYPVFHEDGSYGYNYTAGETAPNPMRQANSRGVGESRRINVNTDFILKQDLDFVTKGLSAKFSVSFDNTFYTEGGIQDGGQVRQLWIDPRIIDMKPGETREDYIEGYIKNQATNHDYDWVQGSPVYAPEESGNGGQSERRLFYQAQLNYARSFNLHDFGILGLVNREEYAKGSMFPRYREDWVGRVTYAFDNRYLFDSSFGYNGSEKFGEGYRFGFFPSAAVGWVLSNESFFQKDWLSNLKLRYSIGKVGNDRIGERWSYRTGWKLDTDNTYFGDPTVAKSPYNQYIETFIGNPDLQWEEALKQNLGIDVAVFRNRLGMTIELFKEYRSKIFMEANDRTIAPYYGQKPASGNIGEVEVKGYEFELIYRNTLKNVFNYYVSINHTGARDLILYAEDPPLFPDYQKKEAFPIGQRSGMISAEFLNNWDEVYSSTPYQVNNASKLPGDWRILDFNASGVLDPQSAAPYGFPLNRPQHTYSLTLGGDFKGFNFNMQFYGHYNIGRNYNAYLAVPFYNTLETGQVMPHHLDMWTPENPSGRFRHQRISYQANQGYGISLTEDGSLLRLKNAEIGYTLNKGFISRIGANSVKFYLQGYNIFLWSNMVEDREMGSTVGSLYPITKSFNLGATVRF